MTTLFRLSSDAHELTQQEGAPKLDEVAHKIASAYVENIPVHHGTAKRLTSTSVEAADAGSAEPKAKVWIHSPFWHFLEYGTRFNAAYRTIQNTVTGLGLPYTPK